jgi:isopentenyl phosphate kinase
VRFVKYIEKINVIKIGGGFAAPKPVGGYSQHYVPKANYDNMRSACKGVSDAIESIDNNHSIENVIVIGGGNHAHSKVLEYGLKRGYIQNGELKAVLSVNDYQKRLVGKLTGVMDEFKLKYFPFDTPSITKMKDGKINNIGMENIFDSVKNGQIPILYGAIVNSVRNGNNDDYDICSGDDIAVHLASALNSEFLASEVEITMISDVDGIYTENPENKENDPHLIKTVDTDNYDLVRTFLGSGGKGDVTGSMLGKVDKLIQANVLSRIVNGKKPEDVTKALLELPPADFNDSPGTHIYPGSDPHAFWNTIYFGGYKNWRTEKWAKPLLG